MSARVQAQLEDPATQARLREEYAAAERTRRSLERFHAPDVVRRLMMDSSQGVHRDGLFLEPLTATVLFCDLAGFTLQPGASIRSEALRVAIPRDPHTGLEGKFSMPYAVAAAVLDGKFSLWSFSDEAVRRPEIAALYDKVDTHETPACRGDDPNFDKKSSGSRGFVEVEVKLKDGRRDQIRIDVPLGHPSRALTWDELHDKFLDCAKQAPRISTAAAEAAFADIKNLQAVADINTIVGRLH